MSIARSQLPAALVDRLAVPLVGRWLRARRARPGGEGPMVVFSRDTVGDAILVNGIYERRELDALTRWLAENHAARLDTVALDIGANIGNHARVFAGLFRRVVAFEPNPRVFRVLELNTEDDERIERFRLALSNRTGPAAMSVPERNAGAGHLAANGDIVIETARLDDIAADFASIGLMKIDVEGHEAAVLEGARETIARDRPIIVFEQLAREIDHGSSAVIDWLRAAGYRRFSSVGPPAMLREWRALRPFAGLAATRVRRCGRFARVGHPMVIAEHGAPLS